MSRRLHLTLLPGRFAVCRFAAAEAVPSLDAGTFVSVTRTERELSVVCGEDQVPAGARVEKSWACLEVAGPIEFSEVGVVAGISKTLAAAGISLFVISTFDTDYILVKQERIDDVVAALELAGYVIST